MPVTTITAAAAAYDCIFAIMCGSRRGLAIGLALSLLFDQATEYRIGCRCNEAYNLLLLYVCASKAKIAGAEG